MMYTQDNIHARLCMENKCLHIIILYICARQQYRARFLQDNNIYIYYSMAESVIWQDIARVGKVFSRAEGE